MDPQALPAPVVAPDAYDEEYYRTCCGGYAEWTASDGAQAAGVYAGSLARARLAPGEVVVDIGTGRGELVAVAVEHGAARAVGVEYSPAAVALATQTLAARGAPADRVQVLLADARRIPLPDAGADLVTMLDVVEHLAPAELDTVLAEAWRLLRPGGRLLVHTFPTRTLYERTYRAQRSLTARRRREWPADPRLEVERTMHVNEQTVVGLRRSLRRAGFAAVDVRPGIWVYADFVPDERARRLYGRLAAFPPTRRLGAADIWAQGRHPS